MLLVSLHVLGKIYNNPQNICTKAFLVRSVYSMFSAVIHFHGKLNLGRVVLCMLFSVLVIP